MSKYKAVDIPKAFAHEAVSKETMARLMEAIDDEYGAEWEIVQFLHTSNPAGSMIILRGK